MFIILKCVLNNITSKKFRTIMIVASIVVSTALFFSSMAISDTLEKSYLQQIKRTFGSAEIEILARRDSPSPFFSTSGALEHSKDLEYVVGGFKSTGLYRSEKGTKRITIMGFEPDGFGKMNSFILEKQLDGEDFSGNRLIISKNTSKKYDLDLNSKIKIEFNGHLYNFSVYGIAQNIGPFTELGDEIIVMAPERTIANLNNAGGRVNILYIKTKNPSNIDNVISSLSNEYKNYRVRRTISLEEIRPYLNRTKNSFLQLVVVVIFLCVFIIFNLFKVVAFERLKFIGALRSIGATRWVSGLIVIIESLIYGVSGGILGSLAGIGVLRIMASVIEPPFMIGSKLTVMEFGYMNIAASLGVALLVSTAGSILPILKISRFPVKDVVLGKITSEEVKTGRKPLIGAILLIVGCILPVVATFRWVLILDTIGMLFILAAVILMLPNIISLFIKAFERIYEIIFNNEGILALRNLRKNKNVLASVSLITIAISCTLMIQNVGDSVIQALTDYYKSNNFEIQMSLKNANRELEKTIVMVDGVKGAYGIYETRGEEVEIAGTNKTVKLLQGVDTEKFLEYFNLNMSQDVKNAVKKLDEGRNIILANTLKEALGIDENDTVILNMKTGEQQYKVIGFFDTIENYGSYALLSEQYLKTDMKKDFYSRILIKTDGNPQEVQKSIVSKLKGTDILINTVDELRQNDIKSNEQKILVMNAFALITLIVGAIGILNNFIINFIERKCFEGVLRSIGMSRLQSVKVIIIESLTTGVIGGLFGILTGIVLISIIPHVMKAYGFPVIANYQPLSIAIFFFMGVASAVVASAGPALMSSKLSIIESIKYE